MLVPHHCICFLVIAALARVFAAETPVITTEPFGSDRARAVVSRYPIRGQLADASIPPRSPQETAASFKLLPGLTAEAVLHEPEITQPVFFNFDERGRMWVVQFIQYPYPAGLKIVDIGDQFHATYDKVPPAPPKHDRGADRITIHEDTNGDGTYDSHKVFLDGLNLVTSVERGRGGVWVLNPPYLLFYPDANDDDVPDSNPVLHLAGFGLEDTHSVANSLRWGPDGWLYGAHGSGSTAKVERVGIDRPGDGFAFRGQGIWRYHPERRVFELFAEGGGNTFAVVMDAQARIFSGNNGGDVRGFHYVQGGFYRKSWGEHGYLTNPYAFGFFSAMPHNWAAPRFTHTMIYYEDGHMGPDIEDRFIAPNALLRRVEVTERVPEGSTYRTKDVATFLATDDRWFRPVDIKTGPDGAIYLADWYDTRLTHQDPRDNWDRKFGRIYRIKPAAATASKAPDLRAKTTAELVELLQHRQTWHRATALRLLADRRDRTALPRLEAMARNANNPRALDALWALHAIGGAEAVPIEQALVHPQAAVRSWTVRLVTDSSVAPSEKVRAALIERARREQDAQVRSQLAASARRLPPAVGLPMAMALMERAEDEKDPHIPLMIWWAIERFAESQRAEILDAFGKAPVWNSGLARTHIIPRLARRYASRPTAENQQTLAELAKLAPESGRAQLRAGVVQAFEGRGLGDLSGAIEAALFSSGTTDFSDPAQLAVAIKRGDQAAVLSSLAFFARDDPAQEARRVEVIHALADARATAAAPALLEVLASSVNTLVRESALAALGRFGQKQFVADVLQLWPRLDSNLRYRALLLFVTRAEWATELINKTGKTGVISKADVPDEIIARARLLGDATVSKLADRYFGKPQHRTTAEKLRRVDELAAFLSQSRKGDAAAGRVLFEQRCAACHKLHGAGGELGPDLTGQERGNTASMLLSIIDPNASIREGYGTFQVVTKDGRSLVGFIQERDATRLVLRDPAGQRTAVALQDIQSEQAIAVSLMPEGLLEGLSPDQLRDFFAYLTSTENAPRSASARN